MGVVKNEERSGFWCGLIEKKREKSGVGEVRSVEERCRRRNYTARDEPKKIERGNPIEAT